MNAAERFALYRRVIAAYGQAHQILKVLEEFGECAAAIARYFAGERVTADLRTELICELADAEITREQVMLMAGITAEDLAAAKAWKLERLLKLVEERESKCQPTV